MFIQSASLALNLTTFANHYASESGGALYVNEVFSGWGAALTLWYCNFTGNSAGSFGGAVYVSEGGVKLYGVSMRGNVAGLLGSSLFIASSLTVQASRLQIEHDCAMNLRESSSSCSL